MPFEHPYRHVNVAGVREARIDVDIADLVEALNYIGYVTDNSCQDNHDDRVWISFNTAFVAEEFMSLIIRDADDKLRECVSAATTTEYGKASEREGYGKKNRWWVDSFCQPLPHPRAGMKIFISVRFPRKHLAKVTKIVLKQAEQKKKVVEKRLQEGKVYDPKDRRPPVSS